MTTLEEVENLLRHRPVVLRREHPELATTMDWLVRTGRLVPVLPGVYAPAERGGDFDVRVAAVSRWAPDAVVVHRSAARMSFWPELRPDVVECALRSRSPHPGFRFLRRAVPPELVHEIDGVRLTCPALTALDLCAEGADPLDRVLRSRCATLDDLHRAFDLTRHRRGNGRRLAHLLDSRDEPWSAAERLAHRLLREAGIRSWKANRPVVLGGRLYYIDIAFRGLRLAVEIDGRLHETDEDLFESDRWRQNALVLDGWTVLRFTWDMLTAHPETVIATIRAALRMLHRARP